MDGKAWIMDGRAIIELESAQIQRLGKNSMHIFHDRNQAIRQGVSKEESTPPKKSIGTSFIFQVIEIKE
ncbi:MAG: hypothetical protein ISN28_12010 [Ectothiorhodospiraceae bacterium AqS1]|nr:hypothetical protein [Ectothiorhodospiraceae bacterium AqS1]